MLEAVRVDSIRPNPFQARKSFDKDALDGMAYEIEKAGLWIGALRGRRKGGTVELCFGHRRLAAIKRLRWKEVQVDIVELSDEQMAIQSLIENLQREDLNDIDRAEGVKRLLERYSPTELGKQLGLSESWVRTLADIAALEAPVKKIVAAGKLAGQTALHAHAIGGGKMVEVAADEGMSYHKIQALSKALHSIPDAKVRAKVKQAASKGQIKSERDVEVKALAYSKPRAGETPLELGVILVNLRVQVQDITRYFEGLLPHKEAVRREASFKPLDKACLRLHETMEELRAQPAKVEPMRWTRQELRQLGR